MNSFYNIFSGIYIFDCISFQQDESDQELGSLRSAIDSVPVGKDTYVLSTGHSPQPIEDSLSADEAGAPMHKTYLHKQCNASFCISS